MIDPIRMTIGLTVLFGGLFVGLTLLFWKLTDKKFWKSVGIVAATYAVCGSLVFFIIAMVAWAYDQTIWETMFE